MGEADPRGWDYDEVTNVMASSLIRGKYVICRASSRTSAEVIEDGAVFQRGGVIVEVGKFDELARKHRPDETLGSDQHVVLPGFVNSHHHLGLIPFQLGSPDLPLELWFASRLGMRGVDLYLDTLYSGVRNDRVRRDHRAASAPDARLDGSRP